MIDSQMILGAVGVGSATVGVGGILWTFMGLLDAERKHVTQMIGEERARSHDQDERCKAEITRLEGRIERLESENERLRNSRDAMLTRLSERGGDRPPGAT